MPRVITFVCRLFHAAMLNNATSCTLLACAYRNQSVARIGMPGNAPHFNRALDDVFQQAAGAGFHSRTDHRYAADDTVEVSGTARRPALEEEQEP